MPSRKLKGSSLSSRHGQQWEGEKRVTGRFATYLEPSPMGCPQGTPAKLTCKSSGITPAAALPAGTKANAEPLSIAVPAASGTEQMPWSSIPDHHHDLQPPERQLLRSHHPHHLLRTGAGSSLAALHPQSLHHSHLHHRSRRSPPPPLWFCLELSGGAKPFL